MEAFEEVLDLSRISHGLVDIMARWKCAETSVLDWLDRLACSNCGQPERGMVVTKRSPSTGCSRGMRSAEDYRNHAEHARLLAEMTYQPEIEEILRRVAQEFDEMADRLDEGDGYPLSLR